MTEQRRPPASLCPSAPSLPERLAPEDGPLPPLTDAETEAWEETGPAEVTQKRTVTRMYVSGFLPKTENPRVILYPTKQNILGLSVPP